MRPVAIAFTLVAGVANGICLAQTPGGAGALVLNGSLVTGGVASMDADRQIALTSAGATAVSFTLTGTDSQGRVLTEVIVGPNANTVVSVNYYKTITSIVSSGAAGAALTIGTNGLGVTPWIPTDIYAPNPNTAVSVQVTGVANYTVQYTNDSPYDQSIVPNAFSHPVAGLVGATTTQIGNSSSLLRAIRLLINSFNVGFVTKITVAQQSLY